MKIGMEIMDMMNLLFGKFEGNGKQVKGEGKEGEFLDLIGQLFGTSDKGEEKQIWSLLQKEFEHMKQGGVGEKKGEETPFSFLHIGQKEPNEMISVIDLLKKHMKEYVHIEKKEVSEGFPKELTEETKKEIKHIIEDLFKKQGIPFVPEMKIEKQEAVSIKIEKVQQKNITIDLSVTDKPVSQQTIEGIKQEKTIRTLQQVLQVLKESGKTGEVVSLPNMKSDGEHTESHAEFTNMVSDMTTSKNEAPKVIQSSLAGVKEVVSQQVDSMLSLQIISPQKIIIKLNPEHLGKVQMEFMQTEDGIVVKVAVEKKEAKLEMEQIMDSVQEEFKDKIVDIQVEDMEQQENNERKRKEDQGEGEKHYKADREKDETDEFSRLLFDTY